MKKLELDAKIDYMDNINKIFYESFSKFNIIEDNPQIAIAVSGGADSIIMALLLKEYIKQQKGKLYAITIDHQIRENSYNEAIIVKKWMISHNINHHIIKLDLSLDNNLLKEARDERYNALLNWCQENSIYDLCIGHNLDDQAENFIIRSLRGSGLEGLSAMKNILYRSNVRIIRPLLNLPKDRIKNWLKTYNQNWVEDPSNIDEKFLRVRVRNFIDSQNFLENTLFKKRLVDNSIKLSMAQEVIDNNIYDFIAANVKIINDEKVVNLLIPLKKFLFLEKYLGLKFLQKFLTILGRKEYSPRFRGTEKLYEFLLNKFSRGNIIINGCKVIIFRKKNLFLMQQSPIN